MSEGDREECRKEEERDRGREKEREGGRERKKRRRREGGREGEPYSALGNSSHGAQCVWLRLMQVGSGHHGIVQHIHHWNPANRQHRGTRVWGNGSINTGQDNCQPTLTEKSNLLSLHGQHILRPTEVLRRGKQPHSETSRAADEVTAVCLPSGWH